MGDVVEIEEDIGIGITGGAVRPPQMPYITPPVVVFPEG